jgi:hypothetical protein
MVIENRTAFSPTKSQRLGQTVGELGTYRFCLHLMLGVRADVSSRPNWLNVYPNFPLQSNTGLNAIDAKQL